MGDKPMRCVMKPKNRAAPSPAVMVRIRSYPCICSASVCRSCCRDPLASRGRSGVEFVPMKHLATLVIVSIAFSVSASGQAARGRALTIEDYYRIKTVSDAQISPNGRWVAYSVSTRIEDDNTNAIDTF